MAEPQRRPAWPSKPAFHKLFRRSQHLMIFERTPAQRNEHNCQYQIECRSYLCKACCNASEAVGYVFSYLRHHRPVREQEEYLIDCA